MGNFSSDVNMLYTTLTPSDMLWTGSSMAI